MPRPKILIIGHARHGKDTVAEILRDSYGFSFASSSEFVGREVIWPMWGQQRYTDFESMFEDRVNFRETWSNLINAYNTPDLTRTARAILKDHDLYVGMRSSDEFHACTKKNLFDLVVWVDRLKHLPPEDNPRMTMREEMADFTIDNNDDLDSLHLRVAEYVNHIHSLGYRWKEEEAPSSKEPSPLEIALAYMDEIAKEEAKNKTIHDEMGMAPVMTKVEPVEDPSSKIPDDASLVLDHGYVALMDVMGTDDDIAEAARVSYGRGTKKVNKNEGLINYLYKHHHTSPFEMVEMKFQIRMPIFVMRQWVRHRTANLNEYSGRYSEMPRLFYIPNYEDIMGQDKTNKQGSSGELSGATRLDAQETILQVSNHCFDEYERLLEAGVSREMARIILPLNTYTEVVWKMDLSNMLKFLWLRDDSHAQPEIQAYAKVIAGYVEQKFPMVYNAYRESREGYTLSKAELMALLTGDRTGLSKSEVAKSEQIQKDLTDWLHAKMLNL